MVANVSVDMTFRTFRVRRFIGENWRPLRVTTAHKRNRRNKAKKTNKRPINNAKRELMLMDSHILKCHQSRGLARTVGKHNNNKKRPPARTETHWEDVYCTLICAYVYIGHMGARNAMFAHAPEWNHTHVK